jgi:hypothetical protein
MQPMPSKLLLLPILLALLLGAAVAQAESAEPPTAPIAFEEAAESEGEGEDEASPEEECEEAGGEFEEGELSQEELEAACERQRQRTRPGVDGALPEECVVRTFNSSAVANSARNTLKLTIHYTTFEPTAAKIDYGRGSLHIGTATRHLGSQGVIHLDKHLGEAQMNKLAAAHKLAVQIDVPSTPASCKRYYSDSAEVHHR